MPHDPGQAIENTRASLAAAQRRIAELEKQLSAARDHASLDHAAPSSLAPHRVTPADAPPAPLYPSRAVPAIELDLSGCVLACNGAFASYVGRERDRIVGRCLVDMVRANSQGTPGIPFHEFSKGVRSSLLSELCVAREDSDDKWALLTLSLVRADDGTPRHIVGTLWDNTEQHRMVAALAESEARFRSLFEESPVSLWVEDFSVVRAYIQDLQASGCTDLDTFFCEHPEEVTRCASLVRVIDVNPATLRLYGAADLDAFYDGLPSVFAPESWPGFTHLLVAFGNGQAYHRDEVINCALDGRTLHLRLTAHFMPPDDPNQIALLSFVDITDLVHTQEALRASEERFRVLIEFSSDHVFMLDREGIVLASNKHTENIGLAPGTDILGRRLVDLQEENSAALYVEKLATVIETGQPVEFAHTLTRSDGVRHHIDVLYPIMRGDNVWAVGGICRDVTGRLLLAERTREAERLEAIGHLAGGVAHEFNNLLTVITGYAELLGGMLSPDQPGSSELAEIAAAAERAAQLTRELLAFGRRQMVRVEALDLANFLVSLSPRIERELGTHCRLVFSLSGTVPVVRSDPVLLSRVVLSLAQRAGAVMPDGGTLTLSTSMVEVMDEDIPLPEMASGMYARIEMRDTGAAISPHEAQHIFEPFYSATGVADSAGLGLSSAYGTTKQMGGEITVSGQSGQGNTFVIWLPTVTLPVAVSPERAPASQSGRTVLLVEGDPGVRGLVERIVEGLGHGLLVASNASVAARLCASHGQRVDVVIADVDLPDVTSEEMLDCLGSHCPDARIVLLSGYPAEIRALKARAGSRLSVISKPFTLQTVSDCLRDILRSPLVT